MAIDQSIVGKTVSRIYIANSDDKNILFHCSDQSWYNLFYPLTHSPTNPRYFSSSTGIQNVICGTIQSFVEIYAVNPPAGSISSIGATITTNKGVATINGVCDIFGVNVELDLVSDITGLDDNGATRTVLQSPNDTRDYGELEYWILRQDF